MNKRRIKIKNRIRFTLFMLFVSLTLVLVSGVTERVEKAYSSDYSRYIEVKVVSGDTLWDIAKKYNSSKVDLRKFVYRIIKINNMENARIHPNDIIKIPIE